MKRIMMITLLVLMVGSVTAYAKGDWRAVDKTNQFIVTATLQSNPPKVGDNPISVVVRDVAGNTVTDAEVTVLYDMPGMHHNLKENINGGLFTKDLLATGGAYKGTLDFSMPGEWVIDVKTVRSGKAYTASYKVNVVQ